MKHVTLALLFLFAAQPVQASFCSMIINMGDLNMGMDHVMQHAPNAASEDADCCGHDNRDTSQSCESPAQCGAAPAGAVVLDAGFDGRTVFIVGRLPSFKNGPLTPSFDSPPYRPPIS